ncbi:phosphotransferase [Klebsiella pneumoniae]
MTVVTTADTSQLYALAARHGLQLHSPLTVNELGLDYRIVIVTIDDGRRWVLHISRRAEVSAKVGPEAQVLAMLKNRLPFAVPDWRVAMPSSLPIPCSKTRLRWSSAWFVHARLGRAAGLGGLRGELRDRARRPACRPHFRRRGCPDAHPYTDAGPSGRWPTALDRVRREFVVNDKRLHRWQRWLDDDSSWPDFSVVVHGDLYVGHVLIDNTGRVGGMIDLSEARVDDPAIDMAAHLMVFGEERLP